MRRKNIFHFPDFTPIADVAWLLLIFFLMMGKFNAHDRHPVDLPTSKTVAVCSFGSPATMIFKVEANGHIWIKIPEILKPSVLNTARDVGIGRLYLPNVQRFILEEEIDFGPAALLEQSQALPVFPKPGHLGWKEITDWVEVFRKTDAYLRVAIYGDRNLPYGAIDYVLHALQSQGIYRFSLITNLETDPVTSI
jgi:biopolymer transport protein ExbD